MTDCPWWVPSARVPDSPSLPIRVSKNSTQPGQQNKSSTEVVDDSNVMTQVISFHITGFTSVSAADFTGVQKACAEGLANSLSLKDSSWCNVSLQVDPDSCQMKAGISLPLQTVRSGHLHVNPEAIIRTYLSMSGITTADKKVEVDLQVKPVRHRMLMQTCHAPKATSTTTTTTTTTPTTTTTRKHGDNSSNSPNTSLDESSTGYMVPLRYPIFWILFLTSQWN